MLQLSQAPLWVKLLAKPIGVYIHIPFCAKRCAYCDFYTAIVHKDMVRRYIKQLKNEIYRWGGQLCRPADTVYFGGGTPSILTAEELCELLFCVRKAFSLCDNAEITVEVNPESANSEFLSKLKESGFNRLSIGIQSLDDNVLGLLGRGHTSKEAINTFNTARRVGFDNISVDLMCALPAGNALYTAKEIIKLSPEHISCYMLILEKKTVLSARKEQLSFPDEEAVEKEYLKLSELFSHNGYSHYEISNFAKEGMESHHNTKYWKMEEYIGIGPSAYSYVDGQRFHYENDLRGFISGNGTVSDGEGGDLYEFIMLSLRLSEGLYEASIKEKFGKKFSKAFYEKARLFEDKGLAMIRDGHFCLTANGMLLSHTIICEMTEEELYEDL